MSLFVDAMILYIENSKDHQKNPLNYSMNKVVAYKTNIHKSVVFLYTKNELSEKKPIPFIIASKQ